MLEKHNNIWNKVTNSIKKKNLIVKNEKYSLYNVVYNENYLRTKIKSYEGKIKTIFYIDRM